MHQYLSKWVFAIALLGLVSTAQALESERNPFETPGFTNGDVLEPYSTSDASFTTLSTGPFYSEYKAEFSIPVNYIQLYWEIAEPLSTDEMVYLGPLFSEYPSFFGDFYDETGNNLNSFWAGASGDNAGYLISDQIFHSVEFLFGDVRVRYLDRSGCAAGDNACGVEVTEYLPTEVTHFIYGIDATALPIPEPETYAMMLTGLGLLTLNAKKRAKKRQASVC